MKRLRSVLMAPMVFVFVVLAAAPFNLERVANWPTLPAGWKFAKVSGIAVDSRGRVYVAHRGEHPLLRFDPDGRFLGEVGAKELGSSVYYDLRPSPPKPMERRWWVHGVHVDPWDNVWVTDVGRHIVLKFSPEGKHLLTLGTPDQAGESDRLFNQPTHVWVAPQGHLYVTDGYGNSRVVKFSREGKMLKTWGRRGSGPGEFHTPHSVTLDAKGNVYVTDRENDRIQVFDPDGRVLAIWPDLHSVDSIYIRDNMLYAGAGLDNKILKLDLSGKLLGSWGSEKVVGYPHGICVDGKGTLYVAEVGADRASKFRIVGAANRQGGHAVAR
jgi:DNA-binding beta-propeller fold protein YncE